jgi:hypothetical protein
MITYDVWFYASSKMQHVALRDIVPTVGNQIVRVRVSRLWHHRGGMENGPVKSIHMVLLDNQVFSLLVFSGTSICTMQSFILW